jgi:transcriptional regulator GlxA family with amidase domain
LNEENYPPEVAANTELIEWVKAKYKQGAYVAGLCIAATGLLNKKQCTTNWWAADKFKKVSPDVKLVSDKIN